MRVAKAPPMTCPACGYIARLELLRARPLKCPGCGRRLRSEALWGPLIFPAAPTAAFLFCWQAGLTGTWLAVGTVAATYPAFWLAALLLMALWPPRLLLWEPRPRVIPTASGPWPYAPVITLGLSGPPPAPPPSEPPPDAPR